MREALHSFLRHVMLALLAGGAVSFLAGFASIEITSLAECWGERLGCNIEHAVGAYGVVISGRSSTG